MLTAFAFGTIADKIGVKGVLGLFSGIMALCSAVTLLIPEPKGKTIDEIERGVLYGEDVGGSDESVSSGWIEGRSDEVKMETGGKVREKEVV